MPQTAAAIYAAVATALEYVGVATATAEFLAPIIVQAAAVAAVSAASTLLLSPSRPGAAGLVTQPLSLTFGQDAQEARVWGYGRVANAGTLKYWEATGTDNKTLWLVVAYHDTPIDGIESFYVNDSGGLTAVTFSGNNAVGTYAGFMSRYDKLGDANQTVETNLDAASTKWTSNHRLRGIAYYVWKLTYDTTKYPSGHPSPLIVFRGRKIWDPRLDPAFGGVGSHNLNDETTWTWTQNAALCALDYAKGVKLNGTFIGGMKCPIAGLDLDAWVAAANICDENVALKAGGTEKRYTANGLVSSLEDKQGVFAALLQAMAAVPVVRNGKLGVVAGAAVTSSTTLSDDELAGPITVNPSRSFQDKHNTITSVYYDRLSKQGVSDLSALSDPTFVAADGGITLEHEVRHRFTDSPATAQRINKILLADEREQLIIEALWKPKAAKLPIDGTFLWTSNAASYFSQKMRVASRQRQPDGSFKIVARQETDAKYSWAESTEELPPPSFVAHTSFDPTVITAPGGADIHVSGTTIAGDGGATVSVLLLTADPPPSPFVTAVPTRWKLHTDSNWQAGPTIVPPETKAYITGVADGVAYDVGFAYRTNFGTSSYTTVSSISPGTWNVDTGMIATAAATIHNDVEVSGPLTPSGGTINTWLDLATKTYMSVNFPVTLSATVVVHNNDTGSHNLQLELYKDGTGTIWPSTSPTLTVLNTSWQIYTITWVDTPGAGSVTYRFRWNPTSINLDALNIVMNPDELKR